MASQIVWVEDAAQGRYVDELEQGKVLYLPSFDFRLLDEERGLLDPVIADPKRKNISLEPDNGALHGWWAARSGRPRCAA